MSTSEEKNINQYNADGKREGRWEIYLNNILWHKGNFVNGILVGLWEWYYYSNGSLECKGDCINGEREGLWEYYDENGILTEEIFYVNI